MKGIILRLAAAVAVATFLTAGTAAAGDSLGVPNEGDTANGLLQLLPTGLDPLLKDLAVGDDELALAGVWVDSVPTLLSDPNLLIVDDDKVQCPNAEFQTINTAVAAALPGGRIRVCPGLYKESVPIAKPGLILQAPRHQGQATECKSSTTDDPTQYAILQYNNSLNGGNPSVGFELHAPNITIEGFTIEPDPAFVSHDGVGIFADRFHAGYDLRHNVAQGNSMGIYVNSDGSAPTYVRENCVRANNLPGANAGTGIYSDQGLSNAEITNNYATGDESGSIVIDTFLTAPHDIQITHNESVNDGAIVTFASAGPTAFNLTVDYNKVIGSVGSGIVTFNVTTSEYAYNQVASGTFNGISLHETTNSVVKSNKATGFLLSGVRIGEESDNNLIATNRAENNREAGLQATTGSSGNTIRENHMRGNAPDCYDDTAGPFNPPALVANQWINDFGLTENRPGLCKHATP